MEEDSNDMEVFQRIRGNCRSRDIAVGYVDRQAKRAWLVAIVDFCNLAKFVHAYRYSRH